MFIGDRYYLARNIGSVCPELYIYEPTKADDGHFYASLGEIGPNAVSTVIGKALGDKLENLDVFTADIVATVKRLDTNYVVMLESFKAFIARNAYGVTGVFLNPVVFNASGFFDMWVDKPYILGEKIERNMAQYTKEGVCMPVYIEFNIAKMVKIAGKHWMPEVTLG